MATNSVVLINYHVLFFGLDFYYAKSLFKSLWRKGLIDVLPILEGGIRYVLKYVDKQLHGEELKRVYTDEFVEAPFSSFSTGIGSELFFDQYNRVVTTGEYKNLAGKIRPIPPYYRDLLGAPKLPVKIEKRISEYQKLFPSGDLAHGFDDYQASILYARERSFAVSALYEGHATNIPQSHTTHFGAVRQAMYKNYEQSKIADFAVFNEIAMQKLYEFEGLTV